MIHGRAFGDHLLPLQIVLIHLPVGRVFAIANMTVSVMGCKRFAAILADTTPPPVSARRHLRCIYDLLEIDRIPAASAQHVSTVRKIVLRLSDRPSDADTVF